MHRAIFRLFGEHALVCQLALNNTTPQRRELILHVTNQYGAPGQRYWGCDGIVSRLSAQSGLGVSKVWAYGDVCAVGADLTGGVYRATTSTQERLAWLAAIDLEGNDGTLTHFNQGPDHLYTLLSYRLELPPGSDTDLVICLARGVSDSAAIQTWQAAVAGAPATLQGKLADDAPGS